MAAKLTPMQLRAATQRRNSFLTAGVAFGMVGGVYYYTMQAMSGARQADSSACRQPASACWPAAPAGAGFSHESGPAGPACPTSRPTSRGGSTA